MKTRLQNKIINIFTFIVHLAISISLILMTIFAISWEKSFGGYGDAFGFYYLITFIGIILFFANFFILSDNSFKKYIIPLSIALFAMLLWILKEKSMDVSVFLVFYLIVFLPLVFYKYKLNHKN